MAERSDTRDPASFLATIATQLERDRRAFLSGSAMYVAGNLVLAGLAWSRSGSGLIGWLPAVVALLGNVFYALTAEWELRWQATWRREIPRVEKAAGIEILSRLGPRSRRLGRAMRYVSWGLTIVWLVVLLAVLNEAGLVFRIAR